MWTSKGRSGIGDTNIQGTWEDWDGLSPNGRQYKNAITQETRNLSGQEYWNARKADYPKQEPEVWKNGMANIKAFGDPVTATTKASAKKKTAFQTISLPDSHYERLCGLSDALDAQLDNGELSFEDWGYARRQIDGRLAKAWSRLCLARGWNENGQTVDNSLEDGLSFSLEDIQEARDIGEKQRVKRELTGNEVFDSLNQNNVFLGLFIKVKKVLKFIETIKQQF